MNAITHVQFIEEDGERRFAVLPIAEYEALLDAVDEAASIRAFDAAAGQETFPQPVADRLLAGENPVRVFREHRGMSLRALADAAGISPAYLSDLENGKRDGTVGTMKKLAEALRLGLEDVV